MFPSSRPRLDVVPDSDTTASPVLPGVKPGTSAAPRARSWSSNGVRQRPRRARVTAGPTARPPGPAIPASGAAPAGTPPRDAPGGPAPGPSSARRGTAAGCCPPPGRARACPGGSTVARPPRARASPRRAGAAAATASPRTGLPAGHLRTRRWWHGCGHRCPPPPARVAPGRVRKLRHQHRLRHAEQQRGRIGAFLFDEPRGRRPVRPAPQDAGVPAPDTVTRSRRLRRSASSDVLPTKLATGPPPMRVASSA